MFNSNFLWLAASPFFSSFSRFLGFRIFNSIISSFNLFLFFLATRFYHHRGLQNNAMFCASTCTGSWDMLSIHRNSRVGIASLLFRGEIAKDTELERERGGGVVTHWFLILFSLLSHRFFFYGGRLDAYSSGSASVARSSTNAVEVKYRFTRKTCQLLQRFTKIVIICIKLCQHLPSNRLSKFNRTLTPKHAKCLILSK